MIVYESHKHSNGLGPSKLGNNEADGIIDTGWPGVGFYAGKTSVTLLGETIVDQFETHDAVFYYKSFTKGGVLVMVQE